LLVNALRNGKREQLFRDGSPQCRPCAREAEQRNPVVRIATGIIAAPRERWAKEVIARLLKIRSGPRTCTAGTSSRQLFQIATG
jgi:hypothetical protein